MDKEYIKAKLMTLPDNPGSYQMKDKNGEIIYVGKAKNLHNRVNQYFVGVHDFKTSKMVSNIEDFDFIVTSSEKEALLLEINLIKKYRPKYNIMFIDDSSYPYIKLTREEYPRLLIARDMKKDKKARYFGPFPDATAARETLRLLQSLYPFRRCTRMPNKVCLYYHMGQCLGPCAYDIDKKLYDEMSEKVSAFLNGDTAQIKKDLRQKMLQASENLEFEKANEYKNLLDSIERVVDKQMIELDTKGNRDAFAYYADKGYISIAGFLVRNGTVLQKEFRLRPLYASASDAFTSFLIQYYEDHPLPKEIVIPKEEDSNTLSEILSSAIITPMKGYRRKLIEMCQENARKQLEQKFAVVERQENEITKAVNELESLVGSSMKRVELFDNSHISGTFTVASCVVYEDGYPQKKDYRLFRLHTTNNDIESMKEVIYRRYFRLKKDKLRFPDAVIVDGGLNQIHAAKEIIDSLDVPVKVLGLVKDNHHTTEALMNDEGEEFPIKKDSPLFFLLTRMQDEVHRVAISYHRKLRTKAQTKSILDEVEGIGEKRKKLLLKHFGSFTNLQKATVEEISRLIPEDIAKKVYEALHYEG